MADRCVQSGCFCCTLFIITTTISITTTTTITITIQLLKHGEENRTARERRSEELALSSSGAEDGERSRPRVIEYHLMPCLGRGVRRCLDRKERGNTEVGNRRKLTL